MLEFGPRGLLNRARRGPAFVLAQAFARGVRNAP